VAWDQIDIIKLLSLREAPEGAEAGQGLGGAPWEMPGDGRGGASKRIDIKAIRPTGAVFSTYITGMDGDSFFFIDQHAAHERVLYEQMLAQYDSREKLVQQLISPIVAEAPPSAAGASAEKLGVMAELGFDVEEFGPKSFSIRGVPAFMPISEAEEFLRDMFENLPGEAGPENRPAIERVISMACKKAVKANDRIDVERASALLSDLDRCENPYSCPHGRPIFVRLGKNDIERLFKRA
jgi:DNA mismatch repair protein MutL